MSVGRHTIYNLAGSIAPMFISILTVPIYLHLIGTAQYGVLAIVWMFLGYFGVFDPGLSRATAFSIARLKNEEPKERQQVFWTALIINASFGVLGGVVLFILARPIFGHMFKMPAEMRPHVMASLPWLALAVPVGTMAGIVSGTLEGLSKFALINTINFFGTAAFQIIPLAIAFWFSKDLELIIAATVMVRFFTASLFFIFAWHHCKAGRPRMASLAVAKQLFSYGSWISISNFIVPILSTLDKFLIGSYLGVSDVAIYTIPDTLTRRLSIIPTALSRSLFPKISADLTSGSKNVLERSFGVLLAVMTPVCVSGVLGMHIFLHLWIGADLANKSAPIGIILILGIFLNSLAYLPSTYLQATGRPNINAQIHLIDIVPHVIFLFLGIYYLKLTGVALAMLFISSFDAGLLFWASDFKVWKLWNFQVALMFVVAALICYFAFPYDHWSSYVPFAIVITACALYFVRTVPELEVQLRRLMPTSLRFWKA